MGPILEVYSFDTLCIHLLRKRLQLVRRKGTLLEVYWSKRILKRRVFGCSEVRRHLELCRCNTCPLKGGKYFIHTLRIARGVVQKESLSNSCFERLSFNAGIPKLVWVVSYQGRVSPWKKQDFYSISLVYSLDTLLHSPFKEEATKGLYRKTSLLNLETWGLWRKYGCSPSLLRHLPPLWGQTLCSHSVQRTRGWCGGLF